MSSKPKNIDLKARKKLSISQFLGEGDIQWKNMSWIHEIQFNSTGFITSICFANPRGSGAYVRKKHANCNKQRVLDK